MFDPPFHIRMKERRESRGLSQTEAARLCGLTPKRWSSLERGYRNPGFEEHKVIIRHLDLGHTFASSNGITRQCLHRGARYTPSQKVFTHALDRMTHIRYRALCKRYPRLLIAPAALARPPHPVMDDAGRAMVGLQPRPCFLLKGYHHFFQVSFRLPSLMRVDVLRWDDTWSVLEIDGEGHDPSNDWITQERLGVPVQRASGDDLIRWTEELVRVPAS